MPQITVEGGQVLNGTVTVSGAKNAALPILAATILVDGQTQLHNCPPLHDVLTMIKMLNALDVSTDHRPNETVKILNHKKARHIAPYELVTAMRASFFVAGPLLAKTRFAKVPLPGGCSIGSRPIDIHLSGFRKMGVDISMEHGFVTMRAPKLIGAHIHLDFPSVGATENIMMAATLAEGTTIIDNAAREPEIEDLGLFLMKAGANIDGLGTSCITVHGVKSLHGIEHRIIPDRIEAGSLLLAGAITRGDVTIQNAVATHIDSLLDCLKVIGFEITVSGSDIRIRPGSVLRGIDVETAPYPGFPTDMQAQLMALLTTLPDKSVIKETIFENRFMHAHELRRMGANIKLDGRFALITGVEKLSGSDVQITDLRAGAALILAGLAADGYSRIGGMKHLYRGYHKLTDKLRSMGARIHDGPVT